MTTFQDGEIADWNGASQVGWATSLDGGKTWHHGYIPGTTSYYWVQVVSFDLKHHTWLIILVAQDMVATDSNYLNPTAMQVSRSRDGIHWSTPTQVYGPLTYNGWVNRPWVGCDNKIFSPHFGNCYIAWNDLNFVTGASTNDVAVSSDGGGAWSDPAVSPDQTAGSIGSVVIQPNGHVFLIGAYGGPNLPQLYSIESADGGKTLNPSVYIATEYFNFPAQGHMRADPFPSAGVSRDGTIYVVTADCRFRINCTANDVVYTTSRDGVSWTPITRIPIDPITSNIDHFITGVAVRGGGDELEDDDPHNDLAVNYYYMTDATCDPTAANATCRLYAGFISSRDGGKTWSAPIQVSDPMNILNLAMTAFGYFVANDITSIYVEGKPQAVYSIARPPDPKTGQLRQSIYSARFSRDSDP